MLTKQWHPDSSTFYIEVENGQGIVTNEVAYHVLGEIAFKHIVRKTEILPAFAPDCELLIGDIGCFLGASSRRWLEVGTRYSDKSDLSLKVLGVDIYSENISIARERFRGIPRLFFETMVKNGPIPKIETQRYQLLFSTFVLEAIARWDEVTALCKHMVAALVPDGELYILRLHPASFASQAQFDGYDLHATLPLKDGDHIDVELTTDVGERIALEDTYWSPNSLQTLFEACDCQVQPIDLAIGAPNGYQNLLTDTIQKFDAQTDKANWTAPLFQILRVIKKS
jgi:SAM-dependent methyltransferase